MASTDTVFPKLEQAAHAALDDYLAFHAYQGSNQEYFKRARLGMPVLSTYGRVRGTRANERALDMMGQRLASGQVVPQAMPALAGVSGQQDTSGCDPSPSDGTGAEKPAARKAGRK